MALRRQQKPIETCLSRAISRSTQQSTFPTTSPQSLFDQCRRHYATTHTLSNKHGQDMLKFLRSSGAIHLQKDRPVRIHATRFVPGEDLNNNSNNNNNNSSNSNNNDNHNHNNNQDEEENTKVVHFQRHGQGYHNFLYTLLQERGVPIPDVYDPDPAVNPLVRPELMDAPMTELGRQQCLAAAAAISQPPSHSQISPQVVFVSPLHRTLETAMLTFGHLLQRESSNAVTAATRPTTTATTSIPSFVASDACREELGLLVCNQRRSPLSDTRRAFPEVDFSAIDVGIGIGVVVSGGGGGSGGGSGDTEDHGDDPLWNPLAREDPKDVSHRIYQFLTEEVWTRPEREVAVVSHSAWLFNLCHTVLDYDEVDGDDGDDDGDGDDDNKADLGKWFATAEVRSIKLTFERQS